MFDVTDLWQRQGPRPGDAGQEEGLRHRSHHRPRRAGRRDDVRDDGAVPARGGRRAARHQPCDARDRRHLRQPSAWPTSASARCRCAARPARQQVRQFLDDVQFEVGEPDQHRRPRRAAGPARRVHRAARPAPAHLHRRRQARPGGCPAHRRGAQAADGPDRRQPGVARRRSRPPSPERRHERQRATQAVIDVLERLEQEEPAALTAAARDPRAGGRAAARRHRRPGQGREVHVAQRAGR